MIEVFRTNVTSQRNAENILKKIHSGFPGYLANFDLNDCDHVLRINSQGSSLCAQTIIRLVSDMGFEAEVLPDVVGEPSLHY